MPLETKYLIASVTGQSLILLILMLNCYEMVWMALNCDYSSYFSGNFLCSLSVRNLLFLSTNYIFFIPLARFLFKTRQHPYAICPTCRLASTGNYCPRCGTRLYTDDV